MELAVSHLVQFLKEQPLNITFSGFDPASPALLESASLKALAQIRDILRDDALSDEDCFQKIEKIVCLFEPLGVDCGDRHDFG